MRDSEPLPDSLPPGGRGMLINLMRRSRDGSQLGGEMASTPHTPHEGAFFTK